MLVGFSYPKPSCLYTEYGSRLTLAPKFNSALSMQVPPMLTEIVGVLGSLYFTIVLHWMMKLTCSVKNAFFSMPNPLFDCTEIFQKLCIGGDLFDDAQKGYVDLHLP